MGFYWFPYKKPFLVTPDRRITPLEVFDGIPYLVGMHWGLEPIGMMDTGLVEPRDPTESRTQHSTFGAVKQWIVDSGLGHDLISQSDIGNAKTRKAARPIIFSTANGTTDGSNIVQAQRPVT